MGLSHLADSVLIYQIKTTAAVHKDSSEMVFVNNWVKYQGGRTPVTDTGWVIPMIKSDRTA